ncbi:aminotransferase class III-fold pyridoxal phosphate-dependent enzyme [Mesorhizobium sp. B3-1-9]|uniref:aminotransferase n=1 Tax=unclassified Mesorhizobium TaxID=325217 RepID=UPI001128F0F8|nr:MULTISPECIES: aminotransferase [unclassified Mesorhizobium]TPI38082.1 aminotransferase class III-fold pyridoxal phosphate-dependent enzyme [Mesorhizobium sp. B3-1-9]TPI59315.1 aminotransferase class III-fold pyridoxal phosphate-dependent enzyme [Mesorhizobium sp. B3-1-7]
MNAHSEINATDLAYHLHSQTNPQALSREGAYIVVKGDGAHVIDENGKRYIDAMAGLWCASLGFNNERLGRAAAKQYEELGYYHSFYGRTNPKAATLSKKLVDLTGMPGGKAFFVTSGSEANETMVKLAWLYHASRGKPTKRKVIARDRAFHGSTIVAGSMCGLEMMHREFGLPLPGFIHTLCPNTYRVKLPGESQADFVARLAGELERMILREGPDTIAAFIAEPVIAGGGIIPPPEGYFEAVQKILAKYDILCLDDEVVCGFGRTGNWFGRETVGMAPDMMSLAKGITSSYFPLAAVIVSPKILEAVERYNEGGTSFGHGFTNAAHPVGAAVAAETIAIYEELGIVAHVRKMGALLHQTLAEMTKDSPIVGNLRGVGLMYGVELVEDPATGSPFAPARQVGARLAASAYEHGLVVRAMRDTVGFCPPLIIDERDVEEIGSKMEKALRETEKAIQAKSI